MKPLFDLMMSGWRYLLCTCITEHELSILEVMSIEREFWARFELQSYPDMHNQICIIAHSYQRMPWIFLTWDDHFIITFSCGYHARDSRSSSTTACGKHLCQLFARHFHHHATPWKTPVSCEKYVVSTAHCFVEDTP
jgi:hypothetical protein